MRNCDRKSKISSDQDFASLGEKKGFGFIKTGDGKDIFFHRTGLKNRRFEFLKEGDVVKFDVVQTAKGTKAVNIKVREKKE